MRRLVLTLALLAGCAAPGPYSEVNPATGRVTHASAAVVRTSASPASVEARAYAVAGTGGTIFGIKTFVTRYDLNFPKIAGAWRDGRPVAYARDDRRYAGGLRQEAGHVPLTRAEFERAAKKGFGFQLIGPGGRYDVALPPEAFRDVLGRLR